MLNKLLVRLIISGAIALTPGALASAEPSAAKELQFGSVAMDTPAEMHRRLTPLTEYLSQALGTPVVLTLSPNMPDAIKNVATGAVDISYLTPVAYLEAHKRSKVRLVAKTVTKGKSSFKLMIVVRDNSPIKTVADLKGKSFAFGDQAAILQRAVVVGAGMPLEQLGDYKFIGHYDNIARGVHSGDFDAGILKDTTAFKWKAKGLRILHASPDLPPYNIVVSHRVTDKQMQAIRSAFLSLDKKNPQHNVLLRALDKDYDGFVLTDDKEYEIVRQLVAPFAPKK